VVDDPHARERSAVVYVKTPAAMNGIARIRKFSWILLVFLAFTACAPKIVVVYNNSPSLVDGTRPEMNTPGFWIGRHPDPDAVIIGEEYIPFFNESIKDKTKAVYNILGFPPVRYGSSFRDSFESNVKYILSQGYVRSDGTKVSKDYASEMTKVMDIDGIPARIEVKWGLTVAPCEQRLLPTTEHLFRDAADKSIDRLQNNALDLAVPVVILHKSKDGQWVYVISPNSDGWIEAKYVAVCPQDELIRFEAQSSFIVVTAAKADLFLDPTLRQHDTYLHMGTRLPLSREWDQGVVQVMIPVRASDGRCTYDAAYLSDSQVHKGYLAYTPRNAIEQAFKLLNAPYGWGGMYGEQDCSRFIQEIFASMGIVLPRNSAQQGKTGRLAASFWTRSSIAYRTGILSNSATGGITLLQFPGHVMLFLGIVDGKPYAIHDIFAYTDLDNKSGERRIAVNRVAVTSLSLGNGTKKGSLLQRIVNVRVLIPEQLPAAEVRKIR
jgi:hypothetical protein